MASRGGLSLEMSMSRNEDVMGSTFRQGGVSIGSDHMRLFGESVPLEVSITELDFGNKIGQGACSTVNIATHRRTGERFAVKMFNVYDEHQAQQLYNEILLLTSYQCDALVALKGAFHDEGTIGVILEYMDRGSLEFMMDADVPLNERVLASVAYQMIWGLGFLHYERQIHRDIKPGNALMNSQGQVKLSDFGIAKELEITAGFSSTAIGSFRYMSPERLLGERYDSSADIWSLGMTLVELWNKAYPFKVRSPIELSTEVQHLNLQRLVPNGSKALREFLGDMLQYDPRQRLPCLELTGHHFLREQGVVSLEDAQRILSRWLADLDHNRTKGKSGALGVASRPPPSNTSFSNSNNGQRPARALSHAAIKETCEMSMSMSMTREEMMAQRAFNPFNASFTASGSLSMGSVGSLHNIHTNANSKPVAGNVRGPQAKGIEEDDEEDYEDDFEAVEPYRDESKFEPRANYRTRSPEDYSSDSLYGPSSSESGNSRRYRK